MITTNTTGGNNYDGPIWSPYLKWDRKDEDEQDDIQEIEFTPENDPY